MKNSYTVIRKSNDLIQARHSLSALQQRIITMVLGQVKPQDQNFTLYRLAMRDILCKEHTSNYYLIRDALESLATAQIGIETSKGWQHYPLINKAHAKSGQGYVQIQFHHSMRALIFELKEHYTAYMLEDVLAFKHRYSLRFYELCKQYQKMGFRLLSLDDLRSLLQLEGSYGDFFLFKKYVIIPSLSEINLYSDLDVTFEAVKHRQKVTHIHCRIEQQTAR